MKIFYFVDKTFSRFKIAQILDKVQLLVLKAKFLKIDLINFDTNFRNVFNAEI